MEPLKSLQPRPNPHRANDLVIARSMADVAREVKLRSEMDSLGIRPVRGSGFQSWQEVLTTGQIDGPPLSNSTVEASIIPTAAIFTLPANFWYVGRMLRFYAGGKVSTTGTPTLRLLLRYGAAGSGVILVDTTALATGSGLASNTWWFRGNLTCRAIGAGTSGGTLAICELVGITGASAQVQVPATAPTQSAGFDTTVATALNLSGIWGTASASNTLTVSEFYIEALN